MRSLRRAGEESWPLATAPSLERTIFLDAADSRSSDEVTITLASGGAALTITSAPGREATITVAQGGEVVLKETIKL